jgi:hypothetical protein
VDYEEDDNDDASYSQPDFEDQDDDDLNEELYDRINRDELQNPIEVDQDEENEDPDPAAEMEESQESDSGDDDDEISDKGKNPDPDDIDIADDSDEEENQMATDYTNVPNVTDDEEQSDHEPTVRRSTRTITKPSRYNATQVNKKIERKHIILHQAKKDDANHIEYDINTAVFAAKTIDRINHAVSVKGAGFAQQYIYQKGIKKFGNKGKQAAHDELDQLHKRHCFNPLDVSKLTSSEKKKAMQSLLFLTEKRDGRIKGRLVYNGKPTRAWVSKDDAASPTASLEGILLTSIVDVKENRDVMSADIPNAFIQANMPVIKDHEERVVMKITGVLVDLLVEIDVAKYGPYVVFENGVKTIYVELLRALYGMLVAALIWYQQFKKDLEKVGFKFNPYDPCIANRKVNGSTHTVKFHVDDLKSSHIDPKVNDHFLKWLNHKYGQHGEVKATRGKIHDYLGMTFIYGDEGVTVDMQEYITSMLNDFPITLGTKTAPTPAAENLFQVIDSPTLDKQRSNIFHTFVAKGLFACKRARPDIHTTIAFLCTRVKEPTEDDWDKLMRLMFYLNGSKEEVLFLAVDDQHVIKWYVDASFAVHQDFRSHTGGAMSYGTGVPISVSRKQKLNTKSSTEAELVGVDDVTTMILWTKLFLEAQGYNISRNVIHQDNKSAILLAKNGKRSSSKRTRAINIRYFFVTDQIEKDNIEIKYCPTKLMIGDFFTKPLQGKQFTYFRDLILGKVSVSSTDIDDRSVLEGVPEDCLDEGQTS